ncbi:MAG: HAD-IA family hydrolase [Aquabacterium sp.]|nr:HAD-IA family hydrolase [Aquabacterium sp.]
MHAPTRLAHHLGRIGITTALDHSPWSPALCFTHRAAGIRLAILSYELDLFFGAALRDAELIVDATCTGILKPDPRASALCTQQLGVAPGDCVFVDDQLRNVEGAQSVGMPAVWFDIGHPRDACAQVARLLGLARAEA